MWPRNADPETPNPIIWLTVSAICFLMMFAAGYFLLSLFSSHGAAHSVTTGMRNAPSMVLLQYTGARKLLKHDMLDL